MFFQKRSFIGITLLITLVISLVAVSFAGTDNSKLVLSEEDVAAMIKKAEPLIEEAAERKFKKRMKYKVVERDTIYDMIRKSSSSLYKKQFKNIDKETLKRQMETEARQISQNIMGLYSQHKKYFYVVPSNMDFSMEYYQVKKENFNDFVFMVVVHEMVHALDDQHFKLAKLQRRCKDTEELQALMNLVEGNAVYITEKIADKLNIPASVRTFSKEITSELNDAQKIASQKYIKGYEFIEAIVKEKGMKGIAAAFKSPPVSTRQILYPEEYFNPVEIADLDYSELLKSASRDIPVENMQCQTMAVGAMDIEKSLVSSGLPQDEASAVAKGCLSGSSYSAVKQVVKPKELNIQIYRFRDGEALAKYHDANKKIYESVLNIAKASLNTTIDIIREDELNLDGYSNVLLRQLEVNRMGSITKSFEITGFLNSSYVSVEYVNMEDITEDDAVKILNTICTEYKKMTDGISI